MPLKLTYHYLINDCLIQGNNIKNYATPIDFTWYDYDRRIVDIFLTLENSVLNKSLIVITTINSLFVINIFGMKILIVISLFIFLKNIWSLKNQKQIISLT